MLDNYFTLKALVREWPARIQSWTLSDVYSGEKDSLDIILHSPDEEVVCLRVRFKSRARAIFLSSISKKAKKNTTKLFEKARGNQLSHIEIAAADRIIYLGLSNGDQLAIYLFGSQPNVFLLSDGIVSEAYKKDEFWRGQKPPAPRVVGETKVDDSPPSKAKAKTLFPSFPTLLIDELMHRHERSGEKLESLGIALNEELKTANTCKVYWNHQYPEIFSLIGLEINPEFEVEEFDSINKACSIVSTRRLRLKNLQAQKSPLRKKLETALTKRQKMLSKLRAAKEEKSRADKYQHWGDLLISQPSTSKTDGSDKIELSDFDNADSIHLIALDPQLSLIENAKKYYEKAKLSRSKREHSISRIPDIEKECISLQELTKTFEECDDEKKLKQFFKTKGKEVEDILGINLNVGGKNSESENTRFKKFEILEGYIVLVGKNAKQNDELTLKASSKEDLWMHARGYPGSHTVLKTSGRNDQPSKAVIEEAASIAAYFSKGKTSSLVPVQYTRRKNVTKPKGAAKGSVRLTKEQVVLVEPRLPK